MALALVKKIRIFLLLLIAGFILFFCTSKYSKQHYLSTGKIASSLYKEVFCIYTGGVMVSGTYSYYLTDSVNFRKYLGTSYNNDERIHCDMLDSNRVMVFRVSFHGDRKDTIEKTVYLLSELKSEGKYD